MENNIMTDDIFKDNVLARKELEAISGGFKPPGSDEVPGVITGLGRPDPENNGLDSVGEK